MISIQGEIHNSSYRFNWSCILFLKASSSVHGQPLLKFICCCVCPIPPKFISFFPPLFWRTNLNLALTLICRCFYLLDNYSLIWILFPQGRSPFSVHGSSFSLCSSVSFPTVLCWQFFQPLILYPGNMSQVALVVKNPSANAGDIRDVGLVPGSGRSPGGGHSNPLQYFCLEHPMNRRAWRAIVHWVPQSQIRLKWLSTHACWTLPSRKKTFLCSKAHPSFCVHPFLFPPFFVVNSFSLLYLSWE